MRLLKSLPMIKDCFQNVCSSAWWRLLKSLPVILFIRKLHPCRAKWGKGVSCFYSWHLLPQKHRAPGEGQQTRDWVCSFYTPEHIHWLPLTNTGCVHSTFWHYCLIIIAHLREPGVPRSPHGKAVTISNPVSLHYKLEIRTASPSKGIRWDLWGGWLWSSLYPCRVSGCGFFRRV